MVIIDTLRHAIFKIGLGENAGSVLPFDRCLAVLFLARIVRYFGDSARSLRFSVRLNRSFYFILFWPSIGWFL